jgi:hypothetical protein
MSLCPVVSHAKPCSTDNTMFRLGNRDITTLGLLHVHLPYYSAGHSKLTIFVVAPTVVFRDF